MTVEKLATHPQRIPSCVCRIAAHRMTDGPKMNADLVGAPVCRRTSTKLYSPLLQGTKCVTALRRTTHRHDGAIACASPDGGLDRARRGRATVHQGQIAAPHRHDVGSCRRGADAPLRL